MIPVLIIVLLALPLVGGVVGFAHFAAVGALIGAAAGLLLAGVLVGAPFALIVRAEKAKATAPRQPPPDVPWL
jgi:hypothetical protein